MIWLNAGQNRSLSRSDRIAKYNQLIHYRGRPGRYRSETFYNLR